MFLGKTVEASPAAGRAGRLPRLKPQGNSGASNTVEAEPRPWQVSLRDVDERSLKSVTDIPAFVGLLLLS